MDGYVQKAIPRIIKFSSRASIKLTHDNKDQFFTIEYRRRKTNR